MSRRRFGPPAVLITGLALVLASASACRAIAGYDPAAGTSGPEAGVDLDIAAEASVLDLAEDLLLPPDVSGVPTCKTAPGPTIKARYTFDDQEPDDWSFQPSGGGPSLIVGGDLAAASLSDSEADGGCGKALKLEQVDVSEPLANTYGVIPKKLEPLSATIEVWVRFGRTGFEEGILSRDASGTTYPGHLTLQRNAQGRVWARLQRSSSEAVHVCARQLVPPGRWVYLRLDYGGPSGRLELHVDGVPADHTESFKTWPNYLGWEYEVTCGDADELPGVSPADNSTPWVVGASGHNGDDAGAQKSTDQLVGEIDEIRFYEPRLGAVSP